MQSCILAGLLWWHGGVEGRDGSRGALSAGSRPQFCCYHVQCTLTSRKLCSIRCCLHNDAAILRFEPAKWTGAVDHPCIALDLSSSKLEPLGCTVYPILECNCSTFNLFLSIKSSTCCTLVYSQVTLHYRECLYLCAKFFRTCFSARGPFALRRQKIE